MSRDLRQYCRDIIDAAGHIEEYVAGLNYEAFIEDRMRTESVLYNLPIIGEAVKQIPDEVRDEYPRSSGGGSPECGTCRSTVILSRACPLSGRWRQPG